LVVDIQQGQIVAQISVDTYPQSIFLSPDGSVAYVTFPFGNLVRLIDTQTGIVFGALQIEETYGVAFNSTGTLAYITSQAPSGSIQVVNTSTYSIVQSIPLTVPPDEIKMTPDDQWLYINSYTGNAGIIINASGQMLTTTSSAPLHGLAIVQ
jgi:DNA-binding beta-propeller fold protein YncE